MLRSNQSVLPQAVKCGNLARQGTERSNLHIAIMRNLGQLPVILAQVLVVLTNLVKALGLEQHARIGAGQSHNGESTHQGGSDKSIYVVERKRNLTDPTVFISGNKKNVIALPQHESHFHPYNLKGCNSLNFQ